MEENQFEVSSAADHDDASEMGMSPLPSRWRDNHGNFLAIFVGMILVIGSMFLVYRQNRFVPPSFPDGTFIDTVSATTSDEPVGADAVIIEVTGAVDDLGRIKIAIFDAESNFNQPAEATLVFAGKVRDGRTEWRVRHGDLPSQFAVAAYHDVNGDSELNRNSFGIPTERYGFSRNARGLVGPPAFQQAVMDRPEIGAEIVITIR